MKWGEQDEKGAGVFEPGGVYAFQVLEAEERVSQKGNPYINMKMVVYVDETERTLYDNLMPQLFDKMRDFCDVTGLAQGFADRNITALQCVGREGFIRMTMKEDKNGRLQVQDYLAQRPGDASKPTKPDLPGKPQRVDTMQTEDSEVPF